MHNPSNHGSWVNGILEGFEVKSSTEDEDKELKKQEKLDKIVEQEKEQLNEAKKSYADKILDILDNI